MLYCETLTAYYGGQFTIQAELDSTLAVDLFYQLASMEGDAKPYEVSDHENNSTNDNANTPDTLRNNIPMIGTCSGLDKDHFKFTTEHNNRKVAKVTFSLKVPTGSGYTIEVTNSAINFHKIIGSGVSSAKTLFITAFNVPWDSSFNIKITFSGGSGSESYTLKANSETTLAWYGQYISKYDGGEFWNTNKLDEVKNGIFPVFIESNDYTNNDLFATGCGIAAAAMIFRNLGATMDGYDLRTGKDGELLADPYTALLANCGTDGRNWDDANKLPCKNNSGKPELFEEKMGQKFGFKENMKSITISESGLRNAIAENGYVLMYFNKSLPGNHFMVLTGLEQGSGTLAEKAIVFDPAGMSYAEGAGANGNGIKLTDTAWYKRNENNLIFSSARVFVK